jgi:hypothetical protein
MPREDAFADDGLTHSSNGPFSPEVHFLLNRCHTPKELERERAELSNFSDLEDSTA